MALAGEQARGVLRAAGVTLVVPAAIGIVLGAATLGGGLAGLGALEQLVEGPRPPAGGGMAIGGGASERESVARGLPVVPAAAAVVSASRAEPGEPRTARTQPAFVPAEVSPVREGLSTPVGVTEPQRPGAGSEPPAASPPPEEPAPPGQRPARATEPPARPDARPTDGPAPVQPAPPQAPQPLEAAAPLLDQLPPLPAPPPPLPRPAPPLPDVTPLLAPPPPPATAPPPASAP